MSNVVRYFLVTLCSLTLVLPAGWCCYVVPGNCCSAAGTKEPAPKQPVKKCCQCPDEESPQPVHSSPSPKPIPASSCCCESQPLAPLEKENPSPALPVALDRLAGEVGPLTSAETRGADSFHPPVLP